jgi:pimeloyl-ACP methyl ester carboxylesterase
MKIIKKGVRTVLLIILVIIMLVVVGIVAAFAYVNHRNTHYYDYATPAGEVEKKYTALGSYDVSYVEFDAGNEIYNKYEIWYPTEMEASEKLYPLVVMVNGTGSTASTYKQVFQHLASWGFIVVGNGDENSRTGASSDATLEFMLTLNADRSSAFYARIDTENIGIGGHSQGGVGTLNAVTNQPNSDRYKALYIASPTSPYWGQENVFGVEWSYDASKVNIPSLMVAGTGSFDAGTALDIAASEGQGIAPLWGMTAIYNAIPETVAKVMARMAGKDHGDMMYTADGYMTAWFMYWLQDDAEAGNAFWGDDAEILTNPNWQDVAKNQ